MTGFRIFNLFLLLLSAAVAVTAEPAKANVADRFITGLPGEWDGKAVETPVGPLNYAIAFHMCDQDTVAGVAELAVSDHYWKFRRSDSGLRLTFLSTFGGNDEPVELLVSRTEQYTTWFHAPELALLTVSLALAADTVEIRVYHHHQPHVFIRLTRNSSKAGESAANRTVKSCNRL